MSDMENVEQSEEIQAEEPAEQVDDVSEPGEEAGEEADSFPREYVERLREESAQYRTKAREAQEKAEELSQALFRARVEATGRMADPTDLPYSPDYLNDPVKLDKAIDELLDSKPHLGKRDYAQNIGQGMTDVPDSVDLAKLVRARA